VVVRAGDSASPEAASALERLCRTYWYPLYVFVRRKGNSHEDASDLTQAFFARFLEKRALRFANSNLGKFRTFLLTSMTNFLVNEWDKSQRQKRGGGIRALSLDEAAAEKRYQIEPSNQTTPETLFEQRWAQTVIDVVVEFLLAEKGAVSYDDAAAQLGMSAAGVTSAIHRMRARFRGLLFEEVANTVEKPEDVEDELRHLLKALAD
jgi:DNA-directed RNA polymerase specialized sigma24 family protein